MLSFHDRAPSRLATFVVLALAACQQSPGNDLPREGDANEASPVPAIPLAEPPLDRAALLLAVASAASATGLGVNDSDQQRDLAGKVFEVRIRFGCPEGDRSASSNDHPLTVRYDARDHILRVRAAPDLGFGDPELEGIAGSAVEAVEGFWIRRPWLLKDGCPAVPELPATGTATAKGPSASLESGAGPVPAGRRVGVAQFFTAADPRTSRRDQRAYEATQKLDSDDRPSHQGYNLVLSGRLRKLPSGRVIACRIQGRLTEPDCIVSVEFDRVRIENPETKQLVAEWGS